MAYMSQEKKAKIAIKIKEILKKYNLKGSLSVKNHSSIILTLKSGEIDFIGNYFNKNELVQGGFNITGLSYEKFVKHTKALNVNPYWYPESFTGKAVEALRDLHEALKGDDYFDHTDVSSDYFHCSHYFEVKIGTYEKPYEVKQ